MALSLEGVSWCRNSRVWKLALVLRKEFCLNSMLQCNVIKKARTKMVFRVLCDDEYVIMRKSRWSNIGEKSWRRRALQEFPAHNI